MGNSSSYADNGTPRDYSDAEIKKKIEQLFVENKRTVVTDYGINTVDEPFPGEQLKGFTEVNPNATHTLPAAFAPSTEQNGGRRNRYEQYDPTNYQSGGALDTTSEGAYNNLVEFSEFDRWRDSLLNDHKADVPPQNGGAVMSADGFMHMNSLADTPATIVNTDPTVAKLFGLSDVNQSGGYFDMDDEFDNDEEDFEDEDDLFEIEAPDAISSEDGISPNNFYENVSDTSEGEDYDIAEGRIRSFYSSENSTDYAFKHPYIRDRFN